MDTARLAELTREHTQCVARIKDHQAEIERLRVRIAEIQAEVTSTLESEAAEAGLPQRPTARSGRARSGRSRLSGEDLTHALLGRLPEGGTGASVEELAEAVGASATAVRNRLRALLEAGQVTREGNATGTHVFRRASAAAASDNE